jgi:hypothetical protein
MALRMQTVAPENPDEAGSHIGEKVEQSTQGAKQPLKFEAVDLRK